ncbi:MAG: hypothetical protein AB4050_05645 [Synechococcus sp.]
MSVQSTGNPHAKNRQHGSRRPGAGRPRGTGSRFSESTVVKRIPISKVGDVDHLISNPHPISQERSSPAPISTTMSVTISTICSAALCPKRQERPIFTSRVPAGFPSPADDYIDMHLGFK